jgi:predicted RNase H-like HicB family nuclease
MYCIKLDQEEDGRWIAGIPEIPGALVYSGTQEAAIAKVKTLALEILVDQLDHGETPYTINNIVFNL